MLVLSNTDALLVAVPMIGLLFVGFFRLDELFGKSKKQVVVRRTVAGLDKNGRQVCLDPDGTVPMETPVGDTKKAGRKRKP